MYAFFNSMEERFRVAGATPVCLQIPDNATTSGQSGPEVQQEQTPTTVPYPSRCRPLRSAINPRRQSRLQEFCPARELEKVAVRQVHPDSFRSRGMREGSAYHQVFSAICNSGARDETNEISFDRIQIPMRDPSRTGTPDCIIPLPYGSGPLSPFLVAFQLPTPPGCPALRTFDQRSGR